MTALSSVVPRERVAANGFARPQLTSLVDMMVILLVFLLKSFSVEGQLVTPAADLQLPMSAAVEPAAPALSVEVTAFGISVDGVHVGDLATLDSAADNLLIVPLHEALLALRPARSDTTAVHAATVQCDRRLGFAVLKRVLYTCNQARYADLSLLVVREGA